MRVLPMILAIQATPLVVPWQGAPGGLLSRLLPPAGALALACALAIPVDAAAQARDSSVIGVGNPVERFALEAPPLSEGAVLLPDPRGPYHVGTVTYHWVLDEAEELTSSASDRREVIAQLFYPARRTVDGPPAAYVPELPLMRRGLLVHGFPPFAELSERLRSYGRVQTAAWPDEPILKAEGPLPVVLFSPGGNMSRHWHTALAQELASQGYVATLISHAHSGLDVFPGGGLLASNPLWHPGEEVPTREAEERDRKLADRLARDAAAVLDGLRRLDDSGEAADPDRVNPLSGGLDLERVAIIGHSRGGSTVTASCMSDPRIRACIIFDNLGSVPGIEGSLHQPRLTVRASWPVGRSRRLTAILNAAESDAFDAVIPGANHYSFTDLPLVDPDAYPSEGIEAEEAHRIVAELTGAFLERYLRQGETGFAEAAARVGGGVEVRVFP